MKKTFFTSFIVVMALLGCTNDIDVLLPQDCDGRIGVNSSILTQKVSGPLKDIRNYIILGKYGGGKTRASEKLSLEPYVYEGDTVMYIANYGKGWELLSTDRRTPMVLMSSDNDIFTTKGGNVSPAFMGYIESLAMDIHQLKKVENTDNKTNIEWYVYPDKNDGMLQKVVNEDQPGVGHWELIATYPETVLSDTTRQSLIATKWGQNSPWNRYIRYKSDRTTRALVGCGGVAMAQYLYFSHYYNSHPTQAPTVVNIHDVNRGIYTFSNKTTTAWGNMATDYYGSTNGIDKAAIYLAYCGDGIRTAYTDSTSSSTASNMLSFLRAETGYSFSVVDFDRNYVTSQLKNVSAVLLFAETYNNYGEIVGHFFIADRLRTKTVTYRQMYGWVGTTSTGESANYIDQNGHIVGYKIKREEIVTEPHYSYYMNWGWDGASDSVECKPLGIDNWNAGGYNFNLNRKMFKRN